MRARAAAPSDLQQPTKAPDHHQQQQQQPPRRQSAKHHRRRRRHSISVADHRTATAAADSAPASALLLPPPPAGSAVAPMPRRLAASQRRLSLSAMSLAASSPPTSASAAATARASPSKLLLQRSAEPAATSSSRDVRSLPTHSDAPSSRRATNTAPLTSPVRVLEKQPQRGGHARASAWAPVRDELPILRSQYVARDVRVLIGTRWKLCKFEPRTVVLRTNGSTDTPAALPMLALCPATTVDPADADAQHFALPLDLKCVRSGASELKLKSASFRLKVRFTTAADAGIWLKVLRDALAHARWARDVEETACLSRGAASSVRTARHAPSQREFVLKVLPGVRVDDMANAEILVLKKLFASGALPHVREYRVVETAADTCIVMPKFPGRNLLQFLQQQAEQPQKLSEADARAVMRGLCAALLALHDAGVVHCDLKLENILLTDVSDVRVIDFGGAFDSDAAAATAPPPNRTGAAPPRRMVGTPGYIAPERILFVDRPPTPAADVFSAGIVLFQMLTGRQPFARPSRRHPLRIQDTTVLHWPAAEQLLAQHSVSAAATALLERMVAPDPQTRITLAQVARDPWLREQSRQ